MEGTAWPEAQFRNNLEFIEAFRSLYSLVRLLSASILKASRSSNVASPATVRLFRSRRITVSGNGNAGDPAVALEKIGPAFVAEITGKSGRPFNVRQEDCPDRLRAAHRIQAR